jgi:hypothetical protein
MSFDLPSWSRYKFSDAITTEDGTRTFGLAKLPDLLQNITEEDLISFKVESGYEGRPDLISQDQYSTPYYAWLIVMHNSPLNPFGWPKKGDRILIPDPLLVNDILRG